ncbi:MAG TPA: phosphoglycerate kinase [Candidatus Acidoferrales bacterium]|nr:phosphoglycerate kinase [Candidatus Acidoferrales bacterium]
MFYKITIDDLTLRGRRMFLRVDFNVPLEGGRIMDDSRIRAALPTIRLAVTRGARIVIASHLGRPNGKVDMKFSLRPITRRLQELLERPVDFAVDCIGTEAIQKSKQLNDAGVLLLENLRFYPGEEANESGFSQKLAQLCDGIYVNDAFGAAHRAHASVVGITKFVRQAAAGTLMQKELQYLGMVMGAPPKPYIVVLGGAKVSDKIEVIQNLLRTCSHMLIGGAMAYTFLKAQGLPVGKSLVEDDKLDLAKRILDSAAEKNCRLLLPVDHVVAKEMRKGTEVKICSVRETPDDWMGLDIGPATVENYSKELAGARTIFWNGPMGVFEITPFERGTLSLAYAIAEATKRGAASVVGGGDSVAALHKAGVSEHITHISTGGGASLELLGGRTLPGIEALSNH